MNNNNNIDITNYNSRNNNDIINYNIRNINTNDISNCNIRNNCNNNISNCNNRNNNTNDINNNNNNNSNNNNEDNIVIKMINNRNRHNHLKKESIRKRVFEIIEVAESGDYISLFYDMLMIVSIIVSLIPLAFKTSLKLFNVTDIITTILFIMDYSLRFITADFKLKKGPIKSFLMYPFTLWAIIDLLSILPSVTLLYSQFKMLRIFIMIRTLKIIRVFKTFRYSKSINIISKVIKNSKHPLMAVGSLAVGYVLTSALIIFNVESDSFDSFFDAVYWATVSLTTVGYGDIYPVTTEGRVIAMISSLCGIALVALPAGIITAGYMDSLNEMDRRRKAASSASLTSDTFTIENREI
jgi:voltage-gated potassium channel